MELATIRTERDFLCVGTRCFAEVSVKSSQAARGRGHVNKHITEVGHEYHETRLWWWILEMSLQVYLDFWCKIVLVTLVPLLVFG